MKHEAKVLGLLIVHLSRGDVHHKVEVTLQVFTLDRHKLLVRDTDDLLLGHEFAIHGDDLATNVRDTFRQTTQDRHLTLGGSVQHPTDTGCHIAIGFTGYATREALDARESLSLLVLKLKHIVR